MSLTVDASVGTTTADSYVTVAEADDYFASSFNRLLWATATDKEALVISASRLLDAYIDWNGVKADPLQSMEWPRSESYDKYGVLYPNNFVPTPVKFAVFELAYYLLDNGGLSFSKSIVDQVKVGSIAVKFNQAAKDLGIPYYITALVAALGTIELPDSTKIHTVKLVRT